MDDYADVGFPRRWGGHWFWEDFADDREDLSHKFDRCAYLSFLINGEDSISFIPVDYIDENDELFSRSKLLGYPFPISFTESIKNALASEWNGDKYIVLSGYSNLNEYEEFAFRIPYLESTISKNIYDKIGNLIYMGFENKKLYPFHYSKQEIMESLTKAEITMKTIESHYLINDERIKYDTKLANCLKDLKHLKQGSDDKFTIYIKEYPIMVVHLSIHKEEYVIVLFETIYEPKISVVITRKPHTEEEKQLIYDYFLDKMDSVNPTSLIR